MLHRHSEIPKVVCLFFKIRVCRHAQSFTVGPKFRGVKMLPPGLHHVAYSAPAAQGPAFAPTASFFFLAASRGVAVRRWDPATELLLELQDPDEVCSRPAADRRSCESNLADWLLCSAGEARRDGL